VTVSVQDAPAAIIAVQVFVSANSPVGTTLLIVRLAVVLVFFSVTVLAALVVPRGCAAKFSVTGVRVTVCAADVGAREIMNEKSRNNDKHADRQGPALGLSWRFTRPPGIIRSRLGKRG
jgi:hypothetical protein